MWKTREQFGSERAKRGGESERAHYRTGESKIKSNSSNFFFPKAGGRNHCIRTQIPVELEGNINKHTQANATASPPSLGLAGGPASRRPPLALASSSTPLHLLDLCRSHRPYRAQWSSKRRGPTARRHGRPPAAER
jgi:hypothetical protein